MKRSHHHHHHHQKGTTSSRFPKRRVINAFIYNFFLFTSGLAAGVILNSYIRNASFNLLHLTNFSNIISPSPNSPAPAAAIFPPSPSPTIQPPEATPFQPPIEDDHDQNDVVVHRVGLVEYLKVPDVRHDMEEEELLWRASMVSKLRKYPFKRIPKVAFLFLTKGPIVLHQMWEMFFKGVDQGLYSIYVHSNPFYSEPSDESPIFRGRRIPSKQPPPSLPQRPPSLQPRPPSFHPLSSSLHLLLSSLHPNLQNTLSRRAEVRETDSGRKGPSDLEKGLGSRGSSDLEKGRQRACTDLRFRRLLDYLAPLLRCHLCSDEQQQCRPFLQFRRYQWICRLNLSKQIWNPLLSGRHPFLLRSLDLQPTALPSY
ncbi:hypothetical protein LINPERHAP2_LOCUS10195 [Linum perenne]